MKPTKPQLILLLIFLLFATPVLVAVLMHSSRWHYQPAGMTNLGTLVQPPQPLDLGQVEFAAAPAEFAADMGEAWTILYPVTAPCRGDCLRDIESLRQVHKATGRHQQELRLVLLMPATATPVVAASLREVYAVFEPGLDRSGAVHEQLQAIGELGADGALLAGQVFLADPAGNIMMRYTAGFDPNHLNKDLKRLLKWSAQDR